MLHIYVHSLCTGTPLQAYFLEGADAVQIPIDSISEYAIHGEGSMESFNNFARRSHCLTLAAAPSFDWSPLRMADGGGC